MFLHDVMDMNVILQSSRILQVFFLGDAQNLPLSRPKILPLFGPRGVHIACSSHHWISFRGKFDDMKKACDEVLAKVNPESATRQMARPSNAWRVYRLFLMYIIDVQ